MNIFLNVEGVDDFKIVSGYNNHLHAVVTACKPKKYYYVLYIPKYI